MQKTVNHNLIIYIKCNQHRTLNASTGNNQSRFINESYPFGIKIQIDSFYELSVTFIKQQHFFTFRINNNQILFRDHKILYIKIVKRCASFPIN